MQSQNFMRKDTKDLMAGFFDSSNMATADCRGFGHQLGLDVNIRLNNHQYVSEEIREEVGQEIVMAHEGQAPHFLRGG